MDRLTFCIFIFINAILLGGAFIVTGLGPDEEAHFSYAVSAWSVLDPVFLVDFEKIPLVPLEGGWAYGLDNYLNHPPFYYLIFGSLGQYFNDDIALSLVLVRLLTTLAVSASLIFLLLRVRQSISPFAGLLWLAAIATFPAFYAWNGFVTNDALVVMGSCVFAAGLLGTSDDNSRGDRDFSLLLLGASLVFAAKLSAALMVGTMLAVFILRRVFRGQSLAWSWRSKLSAGLLAAATVPYLWFWIAYGSPAPATDAHIALLHRGSRDFGSAGTSLGLAEYAMVFGTRIAGGWTANAGSSALFSMPIVIYFVVLVGASALPSPGDRPAPLREAAIALVVGVVAQAAVHFGYSYIRHVETGWLRDGHLRYYLPAIVIGFVLAAAFVSKQASSVRSMLITLWAVLGMILPLAAFVA